MSDHLTPVEVCERLIGPLPVLEGIVGYRPKAGYAWKRSSKGRAPGELPSTRLQRALLDHAESAGIPLTAEMLIRGATEAEIAALMTGRIGATPQVEAAE